MKKTWQFILMIFITGAVLAVYSFSDYQAHIGNVEIKKTDIEEFIIGDTTPVVARLVVLHHEEQVEMDSSSQRILLIGDSMLEQLRWRVRDYCVENGHDIKTVMWYSSQSMWFGQGDTLSYYINDYKPTYIILVLGANELFVRDIKKKRANYVKQIVRQMGDIPFIWVGPPNWKDDTGINNLILRYCGKSKYYPSYKISLNPGFIRYNDGAHPKPQTAFRWMDSVAVWIMDESRFPIIMEKPSKKYKNSTNTTILQPM